MICRPVHLSRNRHVGTPGHVSPVATGFAAGTLCTLAYLPQGLHSFRSKSVRDLSLLMLISHDVGLVPWVSYGFMIHSLPIILPNTVTFFFSAPLLMMKLRYREER